MRGGFWFGNRKESDHLEGILKVQVAEDGND